MARPNQVAICGGGLAGLAAALALAERGVGVELLEARQGLGGRASSFRDPESGVWLDFCQHVSMGCCTNLTDFCRRCGIDDAFSRTSTLHFIASDGRRIDLRASRWLPPPFHWLPGLREFRGLTSLECLGIARAMARLARPATIQQADGQTMLVWLHAQKQSPRAVQLFWSVVLTSALSESLDRISVPAARHVFVEGFLAARSAHELLIPTVSLGELYGERVRTNLIARGVAVRLGTAVERVAGDARRVTGLMDAEGALHAADYVVLAVPWRRLIRLLPPPLDRAVPHGKQLARIESSAITGIHLWFDQPLSDLPHAVLLGRTSQWIFHRGRTAVPRRSGAVGNYYHVVVSASRFLAGRERDELVAHIVAELRDTWPGASRARLLHGQVVTERHAVFSPLPGVEPFRAPQQTMISNLMLCGDWTATGWPATMEGAVRSGYLAAEAVLRSLGRRERVVVPGLRRGILARLLCGSV